MIKNLFSCKPALASLRVLSGVALLFLFALSGTTGCLSHSLTGLTVEPAVNSTCLLPGVTANFKAYGTYTEGGHATITKDISDQVTWTTVIPAVATVDASGVATGVNPGYTSILASADGEFGVLSAASSVSVQATSCPNTAVQVAVIPGNPTLTATGETARLLAIGTTDTKTTDFSGQATWESSDANVATIDRNGLVTAVGPGTATITAHVRQAGGSVVSSTQTVHVQPGDTNQ
jgi:uncharacterized protein YjdB